MNTKMLRVLALLMILAFIILINGCDRIGLRRSNSQKEQEVHNPVNEESALQDQEKIDELAAAIASETLPALPDKKYGRKNPFSPLVSSRPRTVTRPQPKPNNYRNENRKEIVGNFTVRLSAIVGKKALFEVDGGNETVSTGSKIAGMTVAEVKNDRVILEKENSQPVIIKTGKQVKIPKPSK